MKKSKLVLLVLGLMLGVTACGSKSETNTTTVVEATATTASNVADATAAAGDETTEAITDGDPQGTGTSIFDTDVSEYIDITKVPFLKIETKIADYTDVKSLLFQVDAALTSELGITGKDKDCPAKNGDLVEVDFSAYENSVPLAENLNFHIILDDSEDSFPEFIEHILGKSINDEFEFSVSYPEDYDDPDIAGKNIDYKLKIVNILGKSVVSDETIKRRTSGKYETCRAFCDAKMAEIKRNYRRDVIFNEIRNAVREKKPHEGLIREIAQQGWDRFDNLCKENGVDRETFLLGMGMSEKEYGELIEEAAVDAAKEKLIVLGICHQEGYEITDSEMSELKQKKIAEQRLASEEELMQTVTEDELKWELYYDRVYEYIDNFRTID